MTKYKFLDEKRAKQFISTYAPPIHNQFYNSVQNHLFKFMNLKYFKPSEFQNCVPSCDITDVNINLLSILDQVRENVGFPIVVNSAYRSVDYELFKGRSGTSSHCKGLAVDIACSNSQQRLALIHAFCDLGVKRLGIAKSFIHVDIDNDKTPALWLY